MKELIIETKNQIHELESLLSDINCEIEDQINVALAEATDAATDWKNSQDPFLRYLYRLFTEENLLYRVLSDSKAGCRIYAYEKIIFASPDDIELDLPFRVADVKQSSAYQNTSKAQPHKKSEKTDEPIKRPYGDHWFSQKAHKDIRELTKEYHQLAKKYHPDICRHFRSQEIFQEILNERAEILEQMAK